VSFGATSARARPEKVPSVSETIDWARVMVLLHAAVLEVDLVRDTLTCC